MWRQIIENKNFPQDGQFRVWLLRGGNDLHDESKVISVHRDFDNMILHMKKHSHLFKYKSFSASVYSECDFRKSFVTGKVSRSAQEAMTEVISDVPDDARIHLNRLGFSSYLKRWYEASSAMEKTLRELACDLNYEALATEKGFCTGGATAQGVKTQENLNRLRDAKKRSWDAIVSVRDAVARVSVNERALLDVRFL